MKQDQDKVLRYVAPDRLVQRYEVSQINKIWTLDDVCITIESSGIHLRILHFLDLASRRVIYHMCTIQSFNSAHVLRACSSLIEEHNVRDFDNEESRLIVHTDRARIYTSKSWWRLLELYPAKVVLSMSPPGCPTHNAVSERFNRNLKHMHFKIVNHLKESIQSSLPPELEKLSIEEQNIHGYKRVVNKFIDFYNETHIHSSLKTTPQNQHEMHSFAEPLLGDATITATRKGPSSPDLHQNVVKEYKKSLAVIYDKAQQLAHQEEIGLHDSYLLDAIQSVVKEEIKKLASLTQAQFLQTNENLNDLKFNQMSQLQSTVDRIESKLDKKRPQKHVTLPLRDPIAHDIYEKLMLAQPTKQHPLHLVSRAQFRIICVLLYLTGCRVNEMRLFTYDDFKHATVHKNIKTIQTKVKQSRIAILGDKSILEFQRIEDDLDYLFNKLQLKFLGSTLRDVNQPMTANSWIRAVNRMLADISKELGLQLVLKSHSFRVGFVTRHLKVTDIRRTADLIGHRSLNTTRSYNRYLLDTQENKLIADQALDI